MYLNSQSESEEFDEDFVASHFQAQQSQSAVQCFEVVDAVVDLLRVLAQMPVNLSSILRKTNTVIIQAITPNGYIHSKAVFLAIDCFHSSKTTFCTRENTDLLHENDVLPRCLFHSQVQGRDILWDAV